MSRQDMEEWPPQKWTAMEKWAVLFIALAMFSIGMGLRDSMKEYGAVKEARKSCLAKGGSFSILPSGGLMCSVSARPVKRIKEV